MRFLLDSVVVIDHLNGVAEATRFLAEHGHECAISTITRAETLAGLEPKDEADAMRLLDAFANLPVTAEVADEAARLRRTTRWKLPDAIQAAIARRASLTLVTPNTRDFRDGDPVALLAPYRLRRR